MKYIKTISEFKPELKGESVAYVHPSAGSVELSKTEDEDIELRDLMEIKKKEDEVETNNNKHSD